MSGVNTVIIYIALAVLAAACIVLICIVVSLKKKHNALQQRVSTFLDGTDEIKSMGYIWEDRFKRLNVLEEKDAVEDRAIRDIYSKLKGTYQKTGIVKYDALEAGSGKLSFVITLLDEENNGFIMNVMNGNDGSYCYNKEIINGKCDIELGAEEAEALSIAMNK